MTSFQDAPDEAMEDDEAKEARSSTMYTDFLSYLKYFIKSTGTRILTASNN